MIKRIFRCEDLDILPHNGIEAQKIRALQLCYGLKYDFCRFYTSDYAVIGELYGDFIVCETGECDFGELAEFFYFSGFSKIFCSENVGTRLSEVLCCRRQKLNLMRFCGSAVPCGIVKEPPLCEVFEVLKTGFEIDFEPWYLDMSHRVRHGVARFMGLSDVGRLAAVLSVQHDINGEALLSQIATLPEFRGRGLAARLISGTCADLSGSEVYVLCEDRLREFYQKIGFSYEGVNFQLSAS